MFLFRNQFNEALEGWNLNNIAALHDQKVRTPIVRSKPCFMQLPFGGSLSNYSIKFHYRDASFLLRCSTKSPTKPILPGWSRIPGSPHLLFFGIWSHFFATSWHGIHLKQQQKTDDSFSLYCLKCLQTWSMPQKKHVKVAILIIWVSMVLGCFSFHFVPHWHSKTRIFLPTPPKTATGCNGSRFVVLATCTEKPHSSVTLTWQGGHWYQGLWFTRKDG